VVEHAVVCWRQLNVYFLLDTMVVSTQHVKIELWNVPSSIPNLLPTAFPIMNNGLHSDPTSQTKTSVDSFIPFLTLPIIHPSGSHILPSTSITRIISFCNSYYCLLMLRPPVNEQTIRMVSLFLLLSCWSPFSVDHSKLPLYPHYNTPSLKILQLCFILLK
jgi:hypothetical protein